MGSFPCTIAADGVTSVALSCETTDSFSLVGIKDLQITVVYNGQLYTVPSTTYAYQDSDTPYIYDVFPSSSISNTRLNYYARHRVLNVGDGLRDMGDFIGLYVGDSICSMFDITQDSISYNSINRAQCNQSPTQMAGKYNITEHVVAGWARK